MPHYLDSFRERHKADLFSNELDKKIIELSALIEISQTLNSTLNLKSILDNILLVPMGRMMISRGIILFESQPHQYKIESVKGLPFSMIGEEIRIADLPDYPLMIDKVDSKKEWKTFFTQNKISFMVPLSSSRDFRGILGFGDKITGQSFVDEEAEFLSSLGNIAVQAIENALIYNELHNVNRELDGRIQELNTLFEIGNELNRQFEEDKILRQLSYSLMGQLLINQFFVLLKKDNWLQVAFHKGSLFSINKLQNCMHLCQSLPDLLSPIIIEADEKQFEQLYTMGIRAIIPMKTQNKPSGYIFLGEKLDKKKISQANLEFLSTLANMAMSALDNARLFKETLEKQRMEEELNLAKTIQEQLLPTKMPKLINYDVYGVNIPSKRVGGDYFDIIPLENEQYIFTIADVSGKGMPASLLMSNLQAGLKTLSMETYPLDQITERLNSLILQNTTVDKYITFFILKINLTSGDFEYVNAGHNPPLWFKQNNSYEELDKGGIILGMMAEMPYETGKGLIEPGDRITMYTDGVTEAMNPDGDEYQESRLIDFLNTNHNKYNSKQLVDLLIKDIDEFTAGDPSRNDDITVLTFSRIPD
ncbi:MAG: SpoIIE family protein phosphatase [Calditrichaceae bacterium]|nr:SpoIIE family protein phosphatase [Calditrichaceae bacterium]MBN2708055.1 SpoIIE family protein phosphatase [Calditrichaceae bacterium]RQV92296.1 MAG: hypothetical protein EH224_15935 [Calditrichota bacterium]